MMEDAVAWVRGRVPAIASQQLAEDVCAAVASLESTLVATSQPLSSVPIVVRIDGHATPTVVVKWTRSARFEPRRFCGFKDDEDRT